jgi:eukaryotic-like serine/threonine-protein kinase
MDTDRWQQVKAIFSSAAELAPAERRQFLENSCGEDRALREEVESLLRYEGVSTVSGVAGSAPADDRGGVGLKGRRLGPYQLLHQVGRGGMASVYLAIRADDQYSKQVAIKLLDGVTNSEEVVRRFRNERQTLAVLDHPNIVKLLDGGATPDGLLYLVMDYVQGVPISDYCDAHRLTVDERLELFRTVCAAVHYAHQNLVIHRDLKPGNILVNSNGAPKLLDFGIAKLLNPEFLGQAGVTRAAVHPMTPEYASPEQVRGEPVTTATDVYSLGVILYELLAGCPPYRIGRATLPELERVVCLEEPQRPSAAVLQPDTQVDRRPAEEGQHVPGATSAARGEPSPRKLSERLAGDLDNIVLMALRKEPQRRYASAEQLAEDLGRHLDRQPVIARKATAWYRTGKFVRRHRVAVVAAAAVFALLVFAVVLTTREARIANRERLLAQGRFNDVRTLADSFLFDFDSAIKNLPGSTPARQLVVRKALDYLSRLEDQTAGDASLQKDLVRAYLRVGDIQGSPITANLGDVQGALESYAKAQRIALDLRRSRPRDPEAAALLAKAGLKIAYAELFTGRPRDAVADLNRSAAILESVAHGPGADLEAQLDLIDTYSSLGDAYGHGSVMNLDLPGKSLAYFQKSRDLAQGLLDAHPDDREVLRRVAIAESKIGDILLAQGESRQAVEHHRASLTDFARLAASDPKNAIAQRELAIGYARLAKSLRVAGEQEEADELESKAIPISEKLYAADPTNMQAKFDLAVGYRDMSVRLEARGNLAGAADYFGRAIKLVSEMAATDPANAERQAQLADGLISFGALLVTAGRTGEARDITGRALEIQGRLARAPGASADTLLTYAHDLLTCEPAELREPSSALHFALETQKLDPTGLETLETLASAYFANGRTAQAIETDTKALDTLSKQPEGAAPGEDKRIKLELARFRQAAVRAPTPSASREPVRP